MQIRMCLRLVVTGLAERDEVIVTVRSALAAGSDVMSFKIGEPVRLAVRLPTPPALVIVPP
jgi:hypothetical protein